jgi:hypothetical protein
MGFTQAFPAKLNQRISELIGDYVALRGHASDLRQESLDLHSIQDGVAIWIYVPEDRIS